MEEMTDEVITEMIKDSLGVRVLIKEDTEAREAVFRTPRHLVHINKI